VEPEGHSQVLEVVSNVAVSLQIGTQVPSVYSTSFFEVQVLQSTPLFLEAELQESDESYLPQGTVFLNNI
jgi:hypothetical protein